MRPALTLLAVAALALVTAAPPAQDGARRERLQQVLHERLGALAPGVQAAVALADGSTVAFATGFTDATRATAMPADGKLLAGSTGKTFFAALACQLAAAGQLDLDARLARWLGDEPWFGQLPNAQHVTVRHLLMHRSGIMRYEFDPRFVETLLARPDHRFTPQEEIAFVLGQQPRFAAGEGFDYSDTNYVLLGLVLERVTGAPCYEEIERRFLQPLGLRHTVPSVGRRIPGLLQGHAGAGNPFGGRDAMLVDGELPFDPGFEGAGGGFATTATDLARWAHALYGDDVLGALREQAVAGEPAPPLGKDTKYGLGVIVEPTPLGPSWGHRGFFPGYRSELRWFPELRVAVAMLANSSAERRLPRALAATAVELARVAVLELADPAANSGGDVAIVGARVVDGTGAPPRAGCTVLVRGERIAAVGPGVRVPAGATVVDATGMTLLPGMFDTHGHCFTVDGKEQYEAFPLLFLAAGVTTVFSPGEKDPAGAYALRDRLARGEQIGARLLTAGPYFEKGRGELDWLVGYADEAEALRWLEQHGPRMDGLKLQMQITEDECKAILDAAHARGIKVTGHLGSVTARRAIELGIDRLEHGLFAMSEFAPYEFEGIDAWAAKFGRLGELDLDSAPVQELIDLIVSRRVALSATTVAFAAWAPDFEPLAPDWDSYLSPAIRRIEKGRALRVQQLAGERGEQFAAGVRKQLEFCKRVHDRGGVVVTGTDTGDKRLIPGFGVHRELALLVRAGFTPLAAIRAATGHAAWALGVDRDLGTIEAGKVADLVLVTGDPTIDIAAIGNTQRVWKAGRAFEPAKLRELARGKIQ